ncbi:hypothetical protein [Providencia rettgeri]|uniref:hypothetical protein n=1 Tax=Providencia rettgeri TaxID=587 RepID=UPI00065E21A8|nr:hypothetical protein [Providencia rettgeri]
MNNKLTEEIEILQRNAGTELKLSWDIHRWSMVLMIADHYLSIGNVKEARTWIQSIYQWIEPEMHDDMKAHSSDLNSWFNQQIENSVSHEEAVKFIRKLCPEIEKLRKEPLFNKEQMKLGVLFARNHLIGSYRANFIDCDSKEFAKFMSLLSHIANESIDIELMMGDVLACNEQAEEWIKTELERHNEI